ncbi:hypothetical protein SAMN02910368_01127 [Lachnospiraceae bacterium G11]|nr:hypothetical protein SAMN02910368_01127 [Lachnospiraceae bacterium G11]
MSISAILSQLNSVFFYFTQACFFAGFFGFYFYYYRNRSIRVKE